jgi:hypothetical protein
MTTLDAMSLINPQTTIEVCRRIDDLVSMGTTHKQAQMRVRDVMNGGSKGLRALVGRTGEKDVDTLDSLPAGNPMLSGITHLSTKLQQVPDLRVTPARDSDVAKKAAETRERILWHLDEACALESQMPQVGLWMPGYGYAVWVLAERKGPDGQLYPHAELRNPLEAYPGDFGVDQQPEDIAFVRYVSVKNLVKMYPEHARALVQAGVASDNVALPPAADGSSWASQRQGVQIAEYYDSRGVWWVIPEKNLLLEHRPNLLSAPMFTIAKRFAFDELQGQYDHVIGLMAMQARLVVMQAQWVQDSVHTETNVIGQINGSYKKGRFAINEFDQGTQISKPVNNMPFQAFQAIDRIERQLRTTARYPVTDDGGSPTAWATGAGIEELGASQTLEVRTYQTQIRRSVESLDAQRLEWYERRFPNRKLWVVGEFKGQRYAESYVPSKAIAGSYKTRRKFGFMAGWDESRKLVGGLQLVAAGIIPKAIMRENLDGLDESLLRTEELIDSERAEDVLYDTILQMGQAGDPRALTALIKLMPAGEKRRVLEEVFMPDEEAVPAQEAPLPEQPPGLDELFANPSMLARMGQDGSVNGGGMQIMQEMGS